jgi:hypothetical protein
MKIQPSQNRVLLGIGLLALGGWLAGADLHAQSAHPPANSPRAARQDSTKPHTRKPAPEDSSKKAAQKVGKSLSLTGPRSLRAAPLNVEGQGGYSSGMDAPQAAPANPALEEQVMKGMLLNSDQWRVGPNGLIERLRGNGQWAAEPSGVKADLHAMAFVSRSVGWVVGEHGTVLRTENGGRSWQKIPFPNTEDLVHVRANGAEALQVVTRDGRVFNSSDGGKVWRAVPRKARPEGDRQP